MFIEPKQALLFFQEPFYPLEAFVLQFLWHSKLSIFFLFLLDEFSFAALIWNLAILNMFYMNI